MDEWCINSAAIDPFNKCAVVNSEDGKMYRWDFTTNTLSPPVTLAAATGEAYTPTVIGPDGALYGNPGQLAIQGAAVLAAIVYSGLMSFILLKLIGLVMPLRASVSDETEGLDITQHNEEAYPTVGSGAALVESESSAVPSLSPLRSQA